ncbi:hypothetical protein LIA77_06011 [Sarocladium implicatum]|nr:hypothetical protein LIA77_06011 [Sarocladium implicatum]
MSLGQTGRISRFCRILSVDLILLQVNGIQGQPLAHVASLTKGLEGVYIPAISWHLKNEQPQNRTSPTWLFPHRTHGSRCHMLIQAIRSHVYDAALLGHTECRRLDQGCIQPAINQTSVLARTTAWPPSASRTLSFVVLEWRHHFETTGALGRRSMHEEDIRQPLMAHRGSCNDHVGDILLGAKLMIASCWPAQS